MMKAGDWRPPWLRGGGRGRGGQQPGFTNTCLHSSAHNTRATTVPGAGPLSLPSWTNRALPSLQPYKHSHVATHIMSATSTSALSMALATPRHLAQLLAYGSVQRPPGGMFPRSRSSVREPVAMKGRREGTCSRA